MALEMEELHLEPGLDPLYLFADEFIGRSREAVDEAFGVIGRNIGSSTLLLVSKDGTLEERIAGVEDTSDLHGQLKRILGRHCLSYTRPVTDSVEAEMERVS